MLSGQLEELVPLLVTQRGTLLALGIAVGQGLFAGIVALVVGSGAREDLSSQTPESGVPGALAIEQTSHGQGTHFIASMRSICSVSMGSLFQCSTSRRTCR